MLTTASPSAAFPLEFNTRMLRALGLASSEGTPAGPALVAMLLFMALDVFSMVHYTLNMASDLAAVADNVGLGLVGMSSNFRFLALVLSSGRLQALRRALAAAPVPPPAALAIERRARQLTLAFIAMYLGTVAVALALQWAGPRGETGLPQLLLPHSLPVDHSQPLGFAINYAWQLVIMVVYSLAIPCVDCTFAALLVHVALRLRAVTERLRALRTPPLAQPGAHDDVRNRLRRCVREHQAALRLAEDAERFLTIPLGVQLISSTIVICTMAYYATQAESMHATFKGALLLPVVLQLFIFCQFGQRVRQQGEAVAEAVWTCDWEAEDFPVNLRKDLHLMLQRAQRPTRITALGIAEMSPSTFGEVMKLSYSYYNLLNEVGE